MIKYNLDDRTEPLVPQRPKITIKDHKKNFITNPSIRLICPDSSDLGRRSKRFWTNAYTKLDLIHSEIGFKTLDITDWFAKLNSKRRIHECRFLQVDMCEYHSSINEIVLIKSLIFAKNGVGIST